ncbi:hypothetical protein CPT_Muenster_013 [Klebsiella phage Muenster]|nr:hypothetical protein CPT_Muenster_013 [Klebsiella phage Muenster]
MKGISTLIDANTRVARSMVATSLREYTASGYLVFAVNGKLQERRIAFSTKENCRYIVFKKEAYKIDLPAKPISGGYNVESLYERPPYTA